MKKSRKQCNRIFKDEKLAIRLILYCRTTLAHKFRARLGFKQYDVILTKEQSVLTKIMSSFEGENMQTQYKVSSYRIDLYFHDYKFAIEIDENGLSSRNIDYKIKRQKAIELTIKFIRIDPDNEELDIFRAIKEIFRHIKQLTKKTLMNKISARLLGLEELKSENVIKSKAIKSVVKKHCWIISNNRNLLCQL